MPGHQFWPDAVSIRNLEAESLPSSANLTDFYLLALAIHRNGKLAALDRHINPDLLPGGLGAYDVISE